MFIFNFITFRTEKNRITQAWANIRNLYLNNWEPFCNQTMVQGIFHMEGMVVELDKMGNFRGIVDSLIAAPDEWREWYMSRALAGMSGNRMRRQMAATWRLCSVDSDAAFLSAQ